MASPKALAFFVLLIAVPALILPTAAAVGGETGRSLPLGWTSSLSSCLGTIGECLAGDEFDVGSEVIRRVLATSKYISYGALRRNNVPCSHRGASYYNCRPGAQANPYSRSCSAITRCRG